MKSKTRNLGDLVSIGPAMLDDFDLLGIRSVAQLARANPEKLFEKLCRVTGKSMDICCLDVFTCAVAQARNPRLPAAQRQWWYWSRQRKARQAACARMAS
jgi:nucleotidyltransferase/DNA polymerase involved in DNA repair